MTNDDIVTIIDQSAKVAQLNVEIDELRMRLSNACGRIALCNRDYATLKSDYEELGVENTKLREQIRWATSP